MNNIYTKSFRNAIGIGARAFRSDYEGGGHFSKGGVRVGEPTDDYPPHKNPPQRSQLIRGGYLIRGSRLYINQYISLSIYLSIYMYIYIHIKRERERETARKRERTTDMYIYIYIYIERERDTCIYIYIYII